MSPRPRVADAQVPAKLMPKRIANRFMRVTDGHRKTAQLHTIAARLDSVPQLVIIAKIISQRFESADLTEVLLGSRHNRAQHEVEPAEKPRDQHARSEVGAVAQRFEVGREASVGKSAVQASNSAHPGVRKRRHNRAKKTLLYAYIAIADDHDLVPRLANHAAKLVHFVASPDFFRANQQTNRPPGKITDQFLDDRNRRITLVAYAKKNLKLGIILMAEASVVFVSFAVEPANRFQDAGRRLKIRRLEGRSRPAAKKPARCKDSNQVVDDRSARQHQKRVANHRPRHRPPHSALAFALHYQNNPKANQKNSSPTQWRHSLTQKQAPSVGAGSERERGHRHHKADVLQRQHGQHREKTNAHQREAKPHPGDPHRAPKNTHERERPEIVHFADDLHRARDTEFAGSATQDNQRQ